jgi:hypothetical protein
MLPLLFHDSAGNVLNSTTPEKTAAYAAYGENIITGI